MVRRRHDQSLCGGAQAGLDPGQRRGIGDHERKGHGEQRAGAQRGPHGPPATGRGEGGAERRAENHDPHARKSRPQLDRRAAEAARAPGDGQRDRVEPSPHDREFPHPEDRQRRERERVDAEREHRTGRGRARQPRRSAQTGDDRQKIDRGRIAGGHMRGHERPCRHEQQRSARPQPCSACPPRHRDDHGAEREREEDARQRSTEWTGQPRRQQKSQKSQDDRGPGHTPLLLRVPMQLPDMRGAMPERLDGGVPDQAQPP
jgi:hypothetical protein